MRVEAYFLPGGTGGVVDIIDGGGWNTVRLQGSPLDIADKITRLQHDLSMALDTVSEWQPAKVSEKR
jgi:hypothetical protein